MSYVRVRYEGEIAAAVGVRGERLRPCAGARVFPFRLLERGRNAGEDRVQIRAQALHNGDDRNRDAGGDEAVFNGGRAGLIVEETKRKDIFMTSSFVCYQY